MGAYILVTVLAGIFLGMMICISGVFFWYLLKMIKDLKAAVDLQVKATHELLGEGSFTRISKSLTALSGSMPEILGGIKEFASVMRLVFKQANEESTDPAAEVGSGRYSRQPASDKDSAFYPGVSDTTAAVNEVQAEMRRQVLPFTPEEAARAHTDEAT